MQGKDVKLLQDELRQLGYSIEDREGLFGRSTSKALKQFQRKHSLEPTGLVDERLASMINDEVEELPTNKQFVVQGHVYHVDGSALVGGIVRAYDRDLRNEELLGKATTDVGGYYKITYTAQQFKKVEKNNADLCIRVYNGESQDELISSPILFNANKVEAVDLGVEDNSYHVPSEYERIMSNIMPLIGEMSLTDLSESEEHHDIMFLSGDTGHDFKHIEFLVNAQKIARQTDLPPELFYGLWRQNLSTTLPELLSHNVDVLRHSLEKSIHNNIIPSSLSNNIDAILNQLQSLMVKEVLKPAGEPKRASLGDLLSPVLPDLAKQQILADLFIRYKGPRDDFWKAVRERDEFKEEEINNIQIALKLGALTDNYLPLVQ